MPDFTRQILSWHQHSGRHDLPWQQDMTPYRVWISEVMLQQTRVQTVIPYFQQFMQLFPDVMPLAGATIDEVLHVWMGLGYYSRARNLHRAAQMVVEEFNGGIPTDIKELMKLPGIGRSTAGAILALGMNQAYPILEGNVKRVLCRYYAIAGWPGKREIEKRLWELADKHTATRQAASYTQAIMDLGALVCTRSQPSCSSCPVKGGCRARESGLQSEIPYKKPRQELPVRQIMLVMIETKNGGILLQKRPPTGIWGGLWSFPECPGDTDISSWIKNEYGYIVETVKYEQNFRHTFSHFHLDITPVRMKLISEVDGIREDHDLYWLNPGGVNKSLGMATPVKKLVENLFN